MIKEGEKEKEHRFAWRKDKSSTKYKLYLERRNKSMKKTARQRLEALNKKTPKKYIDRANVRKTS